MASSSTLLKDIHPHERDQHIKFQENGHVYYVKREKGFKSVTTLVHDSFEKFNADKIIDNMMKSLTGKKQILQTKPEIKQLWKENGQEAAKWNLMCILKYYYNKIKPETIESYEGTKEHGNYEFYPRSSTNKTVLYRMECLR